MPSKTPAPQSEADHPTIASPADSMIDALTTTQQEAMHSLETAGSAVIEGVGKVQREIVDFVTERIRTDMDAQAALMHCKSFDELRSVQAQFFRTALDHYSSEASRLMRLGGEMVSRSLDRGPH